MKDCLICETPIEQFISFGNMPLANGFLDQSQFNKEYFFELAVGVLSELPYGPIDAATRS